MPVGLYKLGGASVGCFHCNYPKCVVPMNYTTTLNHEKYHKPGTRSSWARRSRSSGGQNRGKKNVAKIGVNK